MTSINIQDKNCWRCGAGEKMTMHHAIAQYLKPKKNIVIPVCEKCHNEINNHSIGNIFAFAYKVEKISEETRRAAVKLKKMVEENVKANEKS